MSMKVLHRGTRAAIGAVLVGTTLGASAVSAQAYPSGNQYGGGYGDQGQAAPRDVPPPPPNNGGQYNNPPYNNGTPYNTGTPYDNGGQYNNGAPYNDGAPRYDGGDLPPPPGYDGRQLPPPPPGYQQQGDNIAQDQRYAAYAEDWSRRYCTKARSDAGAGAVIGGVFGALLGSSVAGRHDRGTGALVGGIAGAAGGAAVGSTSGNATSPGCPPGFVVRRDAPAFYYEGYGDPYLYAAPGWYQPWFFYSGRWTYRPYPYHTFYYGHYGYGRGYGYRGGYDRGYRGGYRR